MHEIVEVAADPRRANACLFGLKVQHLTYHARRCTILVICPGWCLPTSADPDPMETIAEDRRKGVPGGETSRSSMASRWFWPLVSAISRNPEPLARRLLLQLAERTRTAGNAFQKLHEAAEVLEQTSTALQLRYLQTLVEIGVEHNTTIVFPLPIDLMTAFEGLMKKRVGAP